MTRCARHDGKGEERKEAPAIYCAVLWFVLGFDGYGSPYLALTLVPRAPFFSISDLKRREEKRSYSLP